MRDRQIGTDVVYWIGRMFPQERTAMQVSTLIFDLYGTLADIHTDETLPSLWRETAKDAGFDGAESYRAAYLRLCAEEVQIRAKTLPAVPEEWIEPELLHVFMRLHACGPQKARQAAKRFRERSTLRIGRMPHAIETLDALRQANRRVYLLSNAQSCFTNDELVALGLSDRFDGILLSSDAGMKKPYRGLFDRLIETYGIDRSTALMVGNDAVADMGGAHGAGLRGAYIHTWQSGARPKTLPPGCFEIRDLWELTDLL